MFSSVNPNTIGKVPQPPIVLGDVNHDGEGTNSSFKASQIALVTSDTIEHTVVNPILELVATL